MTETEFYKRLPRRDLKYPYCPKHPEVDTQGMWTAFYNEHRDCLASPPAEPKCSCVFTIDPNCPRGHGRTAEPKCERCGQDDLTANPECAFHGASRRPPTTEPAESEGKADLIAAVDNFIAVNAEMWQGQDPDEYMNEIRERPTAPPAESVEDAKAYVRKTSDLHETCNDAAFDSWCETMELYAEQYATKQIERQTPAIIWSAFEEVENLVMEWIEPTLSCEECGKCKECIRLSLVDVMNSAMQTVKARRSGGEGK